MTQQSDQPFKVGEHHENRKGVFEVLSIDGANMTIRWDTGEQTTSPIELQAKILRNMEKELLAGSTKKGYRAPKSSGELFTGLRREDFSVDVTGTHWRAREQLGGAVTRAMDVREPFDSWSIYRRAEVHWGSVTRYRLVPARLQTKFFARLNEQEVFFGLYVERSNKRSDNQDDWIRFRAWVGDPDNYRWLQQTLLSTGTEFSFRYHAEKPSTFAATELHSFLSSLRDDLWLNLFIGRTIPRDEAVAQGTRIGSTIADLFNILLPIYESKRPKEA
jgi:hypothetical protein